VGRRLVLDSEASYLISGYFSDSSQQNRPQSSNSAAVLQSELGRACMYHALRDVLSITLEQIGETDPFCSYVKGC